MDVMEEIRGFKYGVQTAAEHDEIPLESTPSAHNTAFRSIGGGLATLGMRPGLKVVNTTALTGSPSFLMIKNYPYNSGSAIVNKLGIVTNTGRFYFKDANNTIGSEITPPTDFPYAAGRCFSTGDFPVDAAVMNNRLFLLNSNSERRSILNETFKMFGLDHLATIASTNVATGSSSMPAETYDVVTTTYDSATGAESSSSPVQTVTLAANERIRVIVTPSAAESARYSHWRVYLRRQTTQSNKFRVLVMEDLAGASLVTDGNIPIATTTVYIDLTSTQIAQLSLAAPSETENNEPPSTARFIGTFGGRLILADLNNIYWSKLNLPDAFPPGNSDGLETGEGDEIRGVHEFSDELFLIFTANNVWGIFGNDPQKWTIRAIDHNIGCASHRSIVAHGLAGITWWSDSHGPVAFDGNRVIPVGLNKLGVEICIEDVEGSRTNWIAGGYDPLGQRALYSYTLLNGTRNTAILPFNLRVGEFEGTRWNPMDISTMGTGYDADEKLKLFLGNYGGQLFILDPDTLNDGSPSGTVHGTFTPASSSVGTITSTGFYTTGSGLAERYVAVKDPDTGLVVGRERIASNNATTLTLAANITGLTAGREYEFEVAAADFRLLTKHIDFKQAFLRKRVDNVYVDIRSINDTEELVLGTLINYNPSVQDTLEGWGSVGATWDADDALFDSSSWAGAGTAKKRFRVMRNCHALQVGLFHCTANKDFVVLKIAALARSLSDRYYG